MVSGIPMTITDLLRKTEASLSQAGIPGARIEAEALLAWVAGRSRAWLYAHTDAILSETRTAVLQEALARRSEGVPFAYVTGNKEFYSLCFRVTPAVLIPRPETELLVDQVLAWPHPIASLLDVGTGSGCIAVTLKQRLPAVRVVATDISPEALAVAGENSRRLLPGAQQVELLTADVFTDVRDRFDVIVSNPPYVTSSEYAALERGVREQEPRLALEAGADGLRIYRRVLAGLADHSKRPGLALLEISDTVADGVLQLAEEHRLPRPRILCDYSGYKRVARFEFDS